MYTAAALERMWRGWGAQAQRSQAQPRGDATGAQQAMMGVRWQHSWQLLTGAAARQCHASRPWSPAAR